MGLPAGTKFGPYEILAPIGAGGMGEVYRAKDTRLKRDVALKVLPDAVAGDSERMARFQREAEVLASLNHPNIAQIYGIEDRALVMELVEGDSPKGPIPSEEAWKIARQIAAGLDAAHEKGIVHRDLKPDNIKITPDGVVKLLDFGLAKAFTEQPPASGNLQNSPTLTMGATQLGTILGTAGYMAPEQARAKPVDKRADIWAFGVVLYELLAGERLFQGEDTVQVLSRVLEQKIDLDRVPARFRILLARCLERNPKDRLRDIGEARFLLGDAAAAEKPAETVSAKVPGRAGIAWGVSALLVLALVALSWTYLHTAPSAAEPVSFQIRPPEKYTLSGAPAVSPDGRKIAFVANDINNRPALWVRALDSLEAKQVTENTEGIVSSPFWSPDSRFLGYKAGSKLRRMEASGGAAQDICDVGRAIFEGASWGRKGWIVYALASQIPEETAAWKVPEAGGAPLQVTPSRQAQAMGYAFAPAFLPDGQHFLYSIRFENFSTGTYIGDINAAPGKQSTRQLLSTTSQAIFTPSLRGGNRGHILFLRDTTLYAQPFEASKLELTADPVPVASSVGSVIQGQTEAGNLAGFFSVSDQGALAFRPGSNQQQQLTWLDRQGKPLGSVGDPGFYSEIDLSPDGKRLAAVRNGDIWIIDLDRNVSTRFTLDGANNHSPVWSRDGSRIAFESDRDGGAIFAKLTGGASQDLLYKGDLGANPSDWAPDGHSLVFTVTRKTGTDVLLLPLAPGFRPASPVRALAETQYNEGQGKISPDGRWMVYASLESGRNQAYVRPFPTGDGKWVVSQGLGVEYRWRGDSRELYYRSGNRIMAVEVKPGPTFQPSEPRVLFEAAITGAGAFNRNPNYTVTADGQKFLAVLAATDSRSNAITVMLNWQTGLKK